MECTYFLLRRENNFGQNPNFTLKDFQYEMFKQP